LDSEDEDETPLSALWTSLSCCSETETDDWSDALRTEFTVKIGEETELLSYCSSLAENCLVQKNFFV
jgi:hypothetical protein